ncbi:hypothetical protein ACSBR1_038013 [Camellia fascicularis]
MSTASSSSNSNSNSNSRDKSSKLTETNFDLEDILKKEYVRIKSYTDQTLALQDWKKVQQSIKEGISEECLYLLMSIACHLPNPEDGLPLMADHYPNSTVSSQTKLRSTNPIRKVPRIQPSCEANQGGEDDDDNVGAKAACYLSANLMKLITKSVVNYMRSMDRIAKGFLSFYKTSSFTVYSFKPSIRELLVIKHGLSSCVDIKNTLVNHVAYADTRYQYDSDRTKLGLLRFVIVQHLELTRMSAYQMFVELIHKLTLMKPTQIFTRICISFDRPSHKQGSIPSRFWRYARIVDPSYFLQLQSKSNILAVAILSELCYKYCSTDHRNVVVPANQVQIKKDAAKFVDDFKFDYDMLQLKSPKGGPIWKMVIQEKIAAQKRQRTPASTNIVDEAMDA